MTMKLTSILVAALNVSAPVAAHAGKARLAFGAAEDLSHIVIAAALVGSG